MSDSYPAASAAGHPDTRTPEIPSILLDPLFLLFRIHCQAKLPQLCIKLLLPPWTVVCRRLQFNEIKKRKRKRFEEISDAYFQTRLNISPPPAKHFTGICFTLHGRSNAAFSFFFISFIYYSFSGPPSNPDILPETLRNIFRAILHIIHKIHIGYLFQLTGHPRKPHIPSTIRITLSLPAFRM